jgi:hypothetical protein
MSIITSLEDGHMKRFAEYAARGGVGFQGYEAMLYHSLVAALEREKLSVEEFNLLVIEKGGPDETDDHGPG